MKKIPICPGLSDEFGKDICSANICQTLLKLAQLGV